MNHRKLIARFKDPIGDVSGFISDDNSWSDEFIVREYLSTRAAAVKNFIKVGESVSDQVVQVLDCVEVKEEDRSQCPCNIPSECYWLKTKVELPKFIKIVSVTGTVIHGESPRFNYIKWDEIQYIPKHRIGAVRNGLYWTTRDSGDGRHLYLYGNRDLEQVAVGGIWEDPMEAAAYPRCGVIDENRICNPLDTDLYTDENLVELVLQQMTSRLVPAKQAAPTDQVNNDKQS